MDNTKGLTVEQRFFDFQNLFYSKVSAFDHDITQDEKLVNYLKTGGFFTAPASTKYHGVYEGGLYDHSRAVMLRLFDITDKMELKWQRPESPFIVGMFHDMCKCDQYKAVIEQGLVNEDENGVKEFGIVTKYEYNDKLLLKGHGEKSVMILSQFMTLTEEEMLCIRYHMGAYEKEEWNEFDLAIKKYEGVLYTHTADMLASKVDGT